MTSLRQDINGVSRLAVRTASGRRRTINLGRLPAAAARLVAARIEILASCQAAGVPPDAETIQWAASVGPSLHRQLVQLGLLDGPVCPLGEFLQRYLKARADLAPATIDALDQSAGWLLRFFGPDRSLGEIGRTDAEEFRLWLSRRLSANTVSRKIGHAKQFFRHAVQTRLVRENPFAHLPSRVAPNAERRQFVSRETVARLLEAVPTAQWRAIIALARFGGLRCPSEILALRWSDVDWDQNRFRVYAPKTRRARVVPLFPELRPHLAALRAEAPDDSSWVIEDRRGNWRAQLARYIRRAGLRPWPRLFQNLRASRETELARSFPMHVVCAWIGNTQSVAMRHYLQVTEEDFARAARGEVVSLV